MTELRREKGFNHHCGGDSGGWAHMSYASPPFATAMFQKV